MSKNYILLGALALLVGCSSPVQKIGYGIYEVRVPLSGKNIGLAKQQASREANAFCQKHDNENAMIVRLIGGNEDGLIEPYYGFTFICQNADGSDFQRSVFPNGPAVAPDVKTPMIPPADQPAPQGDEDAAPQGNALTPSAQ
jgi:hypothetical protein